MNKLNWPKQLPAGSKFFKGLLKVLRIVVENNVEVKINKWESRLFYNTEWNCYDVECKNRDNSEDIYTFILTGEDELDYFKRELRKLKLKELVNE